ncbi:MAG TPA: hypothetical protein VK395_23095 [Gemmataceae bacterium]|nr:hypothetical protein [Gemmataceae bacterium]
MTSDVAARHAYGPSRVEGLCQLPVARKHPAPTRRLTPLGLLCMALKWFFAFAG